MMPMFEIITVSEARAMGGTKLWLRFSDGVEGVIDLAVELSPPQRAKLGEPHDFANLELSGGGVAWPDGFDCAPEWLYERVVARIPSDTRRNDDEWEGLRRHVRDMPEISRFFGIVIRMFFSDHARPHFHAEYGEYLISIEIDGDGIRGNFPPARLPMLFEWRDQHRAELLANWERLQRGEPAQPIPPLS